MRQLKMHVWLDEASDATETILVYVEHDDGWISFAEHPGGRWRCYVNTAERRAHWEQRSGDWQAVIEAAVDLPQDVRVAMHRAAAAGLVAAGLRS